MSKIFYIGSDDKVYGPVTELEAQGWYVNGYFTSDIKFLARNISASDRFDSKGRLLSLGELIELNGGALPFYFSPEKEKRERKMEERVNQLQQEIESLRLSITENQPNYKSDMKEMIAIMQSQVSLLAENAESTWNRSKSMISAMNVFQKEMVKQETKQNSVITSSSILIERNAENVPQYEEQAEESSATTMQDCKNSEISLEVGVGGMDEEEYEYIETTVIEVIDIPEGCTGFVVGKGGIATIQAVSGAKVLMSSNISADGTRTCTLQGTKMAVEKAKKLLRTRNKFEKEIGVGPDMIIPASMCPRIVGKGGMKIRELEEKSGVKLSLVPTQPSSEDTRALYITGEPDKVEIAKKLVRDLIDNDGGGTAKNNAVSCSRHAVMFEARNKEVERRKRCLNSDAVYEVDLIGVVDVEPTPGIYDNMCEKAICQVKDAENATSQHVKLSVHPELHIKITEVNSAKVLHDFGNACMSNFHSDPNDAQVFGFAVKDGGMYKFYVFRTAQRKDVLNSIGDMHFIFYAIINE